MRGAAQSRWAGMAAAGRATAVTSVVTSNPSIYLFIVDTINRVASFLIVVIPRRASWSLTCPQVFPCCTYPLSLTLRRDSHHRLLPSRVGKATHIHQGRYGRRKQGCLASGPAAGENPPARGTARGARSASRRIELRRGDRRRRPSPHMTDVDALAAPACPSEEPLGRQHGTAAPHRRPRAAAVPRRLR